MNFQFPNFQTRRRIIKNCKKGAITLIMVMLIMSVLMLAVFAVSSLLIKEARMTLWGEESMQAYFAADAGAEKCLFGVRQLGNGCQAVLGGLNGVLDNGASFDVLRTGNVLYSRGEFRGTLREAKLSW